MSDNELDAELLALAGEDSASETEQTKPISRVSKSPSPGLPSSRKSRPAPRGQKGVAQRKSTKARSGVAKQKMKTDSEEEGQASSPESLGSGAMSESDSEGSPDVRQDVDDAVLYPVEGKFHSEKDKAEIMAMPELRREAILADRAAEAERRQQDLTLRQLRESRQKVEAKDADLKKRKAGATELDESPRKATRAKVKATENLEAYKRQREQRNEQRRRNEDSRKSGKESPSHENGFSDGDAEGDSDVEWDDGPAKAPSAREEAQPELRDYERIRVGRSNFAKVCSYPTFERTIEGCFCRVNIGADKATGQNVYRMTQIRGFKTGRIYVMEGQNGRPVYTDQYAIVAQGKAEKEWPFSACSDSKFTEAEFERYKRATLGDGLQTPSLSKLTAKCNGIHELLNHRWTEEEINEKLQRSSALAEQAILDGPKLGLNISNGQPKLQAPKPMNQQERLAALNRQNRKANQEEIRKAQLAEKRREQKLHSAVARGEAVANPFARVKTRAKVTYDVNEGNLKVPAAKGVDDLFGDGSDISRTSTPVGGAAAKKNGTLTPQKVNGLGTFGRKKKMDDDILASMDLGIDIDI